MFSLGEGILSDCCGYVHTCRYVQEVAIGFNMLGGFMEGLTTMIERKNVRYIYTFNVWFKITLCIRSGLAYLKNNWFTWSTYVSGLVQVEM